ncbi:MAG: ATP-dependent helicase [Clostridiales bacterium]|nr:ATP-dependent helicase [Clostridiales bacterium]
MDASDYTCDYNAISQITNASFCQKARAFEVKTKDTNKPENYTRAAVIKDTIKAALVFHERNPKNIMEYMASRYEECLFKNYQQKRINLLWDHRRVMRYLDDETRTPVFPKGHIVNLGTHSCMVKPDFCFVDQSRNGIEVVTLRIGKPDVTKSGRKNAEIRVLRLYAMILFGRSLGFRKITASYYFLKKSTDTQNWLTCDQSFFGSGGNVVSMKDIYDGEENETDRKVSRFIRMLDIGTPEDRMCKEDCDTCDKHDICKYLLSPVKLVKDPVVRSVNDVSLTPQQVQAITFHRGIARINAGAGAGKTMVVAFHIRYLIEQGVRPEEICCVTFTNAGAKEMLHRAELYTGRNLDGMTICTFNSFENDIVLDCYRQLGFPRKPKVIDDVERYSIIAGLLNKNPVYEWTGNSFLNFTSTGGFFKGALQLAAEIFSIIKKSGTPAPQIALDYVRQRMDNCDIPDAALAKLILLYDKYDQELKSQALIEFDDQEILAFQILNTYPNYLAERFPFRHIVVDEFQDSSAEQIELIKMLRRLPTFESLMVIGDDSQAIFGFRNTSPEYIIHFEQYIGEPVQDIFLVENHRSTEEIISFANNINEMNKNRVAKSLVATRGHGPGVIVNGFYGKMDEYKYIVSGIQARLQYGARPEDIAVIAYTKSELREIADLLTKAGIPSMFGAPEKLMENSRIRAIMAFKRVIDDTTDTKDALITANAKAGGGIMDMPQDIVDEAVAAVVAEADAINQVGSLKEKKEKLFQFIDSIAYDDEAVIHFKESLENKDYDEILKYCTDFSLYGDNTEFRRIEDYPGIVLVTAHSSKGLEWPIVFNTVTKYHKRGLKNNDIEEIRRLLFVSATRARDELIVTGQFEAGGSTAKNRIMNRFLSDAYKAAGRDMEMTDPMDEAM